MVQVVLRGGGARRRGAHRTLGSFRRTPLADGARTGTLRRTVPTVRGDQFIGDLVARGVGRGDPLGLAVGPGAATVALAPLSGAPIGGIADVAVIAAVDEAIRPRWVVWSSDTVRPLVAGGCRLATCWDLSAVHRLLFGGWRADPGRVWAGAHDLDPESSPAEVRVDLFSTIADNDHSTDPRRADGYLLPAWTAGGWADTAERMGAWAALALECMSLQMQQLNEVDRAHAMFTARSESTAELLCAELEADGLPMNRTVAERIVASFVGLRSDGDRDGTDGRAARDHEVLRHVPDGNRYDLRSPADVKSMLRRVGIEVPDTRAWRLEPLRDQHPLIDALLAWRKAERMATTFGYSWLDTNLGADGRLRGQWTGCDGAAGRMTASAGLHNMPAEMRPAVLAEPGHVFVRADLGQIEPRVLAAVSGDARLAAATAGPDLYAPVAAQLGVPRDIAKVAVLGAMYGQTTGRGAQALGGLERAYPVAMGYLRDASTAAQAGRDLRTYGGRLVRMGSTGSADAADESAARSRAAARGRYGRNALVQGAAAELFKVWAVLVRARGADLGARIVLCLHDELLVHVPVEHAAAVTGLVEACLQEAAHRWAPDHARAVRFVADVSTISCWADAK